MKTNMKVILSSILSLVLCLSLIAGSTFALFTSESKTNIAVQSGKVDVVANVALDSLYSPTGINLDGSISDAADIADTTFANGGNVSIDGAGVSLVNVTPGDKAILKVTMTNRSNVALMQRMTVKCVDADKSFYDQLIIGVSNDGVNYTYYTDFASAWESNTDVYGNGTEAVKYISIELPSHVGNLYADKSVNLAVNVVAVQGNTNTVNDDSLLVHMVNDQTELDAAVAVIKNGEHIYITAGAETPLELNYDGTNELTVRGYNMDALTVNAPNANIHLYNNISVLTVKAVAMNSLHIYGEIGNAVVNQGRLVVENNAVVEEVKLAPAADKEAAFIIAELPEAAAPEAKLGDINTIIVDKTNSDKVSIRVPSDIQDEIADKVEGDAVVGTSSPITTAEQLIAAVKSAYSGEIIKLSADIEIKETLAFDGGEEYTLDLCGYTLTITSEIENVHDGFVVSNGSTLNLTNSIAEQGTYIFNCAKGNEDAIYIKNDVEGKTSTVNVMNPVKIIMDIKGGSAFHAEAPKGNAIINIDNGTDILVSGQANNSVGAIYIGKNSTLNMTGGELTINAEFDDDYDSWNRDACGIVLINDNAHANLTGGKFTVNGKNSFAQGIQIATYNGHAKNTDFVISNAEFTINNEGVGECYPFAIFDPSQGSGKVINATVSGNFDGMVTTYYTGDVNIDIFGGTFSIDPSDYLAEGAVSIKDGNNYVVVPAAKIGDVAYPSVAAAAEAVTAGATEATVIEVAPAEHKITTPIAITGKNIVINGNGATFVADNANNAIFSGTTGFAGKLAVNNISFKNVITFNDLNGGDVKFNECIFANITKNGGSTDKQGVLNFVAHYGNATEIGNIEITKCEFKNLDNGNTAECAGIYLTSYSNAVVNLCNFDNVAGTCVYAAGKMQSVSVENNTFANWATNEKGEGRVFRIDGGTNNAMVLNFNNNTMTKGANTEEYIKISKAPTSITMNQNTLEGTVYADRAALEALGTSIIVIAK